MSAKRATCVLLLAGLALPSQLPAQEVRRSQRGTVMQMIATTAVTVIYNRPSARGRELFGGVVPYGREWNPGADEATTVTFSKDVRIAGQPLAAGKYSLWLIPAEGAAWTVIFSRAANVFHVPYPAGQDALRAQIEPEQGCFMETLAFYFPAVQPDAAELRLHWGETVLPIPIALDQVNVP
ncbi:MAG: DUF2911 domain-containing protein [Gemmatimonadales bacterium]